MRRSSFALALVLTVVLGVFPTGSGSAFAVSSLKARVLSIELPVSSSWDYVDGTAEYVGKHHSSIRPLVEAGANLYRALEGLQNGLRTQPWPGNARARAASLVAQLSAATSDAKSLSDAGNISSVATALDKLLKDQKAIFPSLNTFNVEMGLPSFQVVVAVFDCQTDIKTVSTAIAAFKFNNKSLTPTLPLLLSHAHGGPYLVGTPGLAPFYDISMTDGREYVSAPSSSKPEAASAKACDGAFA